MMVLRNDMGRLLATLGEGICTYVDNADINSSVASFWLAYAIVEASDSKDQNFLIELLCCTCLLRDDSGEPMLQ